MKIQAQARQAEEAVGLEIDKRLQEVTGSQKNLKIFKKGHRSAKAWMRANFMSYGVGISDTKDLLDSLAAYAKSKMDLDKAQHDVLGALDNLHLAVGQDLSVWEPSE